MKIKKALVILLVIAMATMLCVSAFAATGNKAADEDHPATASVSKTLEVPTGTSIAEMSFPLAFTSTAAPDGATAPSITKTFSFDGSEVGTDNSGTTTYVIRDDNFLPQGNTWPAAGIYKYTVKEAATGADGDNVVTTNGTNPTSETKTHYSEAEYELVVGIATKANGDRYVDSVAVYQVKNDAGETVTKNKVDITTPTDEPGETPTASGFNFTNKVLSKTISGVVPEGEEDDPNGDNDDNALYIQKIVVDKEGNEIADNTQEFSFTLQMVKPANATSQETYQYSIMKADSTEKGTGSVTTGTAEEFKLKTGERLVLKNVSVGATYTVNEASYPAYTTSNNMGTTAEYIKDTGNSKEFTNVYDKDDDPATGLSMNNLPYIILAIVALGGLAAYVVIRRKENEEA